MRVRLIDEERLKAEEAQRKAILNLNASGAVARLILQAQERRSATARYAVCFDKNLDEVLICFFCKYCSWCLIL